MFVSLLASIALAIAMIAVPAPKAEAQNPVTEQPSGVARGNNGPTGYPLIQVGDPNPFTSAVIWITIGGKEYAAYCIEGKLGLRPEGGETGQVVPWSSYRSAGGDKGNLLSGKDYSKQRQEKLSWIAYNSYPYKSVEEMSELLGIPKLNMPDVVAATQAAVSHYSDGFEFKFQSKRRNSQLVYDYLTGPANVGIEAGDLKGLGGHPFINKTQDVIIFPPSDGSSTPPTTNQVPPTQPTGPTTSTKPSTSTRPTTPTSPAPVTPENEVQIRTQASFYKDRVVQRIPGKAPSDLVWDRVEIDNLEPGYFYELSTRQFDKNLTTSKVRERPTDEFEFIIKPNLEVVKKDGQDETETFVITSVNPDGTVNGFINAFQDDADKIEPGWSAYLSQTLVRWKLNSEQTDKSGRKMEVATHDGSKFPSQYVYPHQGFDPPTIKTSASFVEGKYDNDRVDLVEIPEGGQAPAYVYDKVYLTNLVPNIKYVLQGQLMHQTNGKALGDTAKREFTIDDLQERAGSNETGYSGWITLAVPRTQPLNPGEGAVVFETLYGYAKVENGKLVKSTSLKELAKHHDLHDESQTVLVEKELERFSPSIGTSASLTEGLYDAQRISTGSASTDYVYDKVYLNDLVPGVKYTLKGQLVSRSYPFAPLDEKGDTRTVTTDDLLDKTEDSSEGSVSGYVVMQLPGAQKIEAGKDAVAFERLYFKDLGVEKLVAEHADPNDEAQIVRIDSTTPPVPSNPQGDLDTSVTVNDRTSTKESPVTLTIEEASAPVSIKDTVSYEGLVPGMKYRFEGQLQRITNGEATPVSKAKPKVVEAAENGTGVVEIDFGQLQGLEPGSTYVVFEKAIPVDDEDQPTVDGDGKPKDPSVDNRTVITHEDPADKAQTFIVEKKPEVVTETTTPTTTVTAQTSTVFVTPTTTVTEPTATVTTTGTTQVVPGPSTVTTAPGTTEVVPGPSTVTTAPGTTEVVPGPSTVTTAPGTTDVVPGPSTVTTAPGTTVVTSEPSTTTTVPGTTVVISEPSTTTTAPGTTQVVPGTTVTSTAPTVTVTETPTTTATVPNETVTTTVPAGFKPNPAIKTRAEFQDGATQVIAGATVVDTVSYFGLVAGKNYTLNAKLVDKQDAKRVLGTGAVTFKAEGTEGELVNGSVKVEIAVNENVTEPVQAAVAFERLTSTEVNAQGEDTDGKKSHDIAKHEDIADEAQTVRTVFEPSIATNAKFANGSTEVVAGNKVIDTVEYKGLVPGKEYTLTAKLMERIGDAAPYREGRVLGEGTETFTAKTTDGSVDVTITVSDDVTTPVAAAVAFEELTSTEVTKDGRDNQGGKSVFITDHTDINDGNQTVTGPVTTPTPTTSEEPIPTTTIQLLPSTEPSTTSGVSTTKTAGVSEETSTTSDEATSETSTTEATTEVTTEATTSVAEPSTSETAPSSTPVVPLVPSNPEGKIDTKVTVNGQAIVDGKPVAVTEQDVINGLKVTDEITYSGLAAGTKYRFEGQLQHVEFNEAGEVVKVTPVTEVKSTDVVAAENGNGAATVDFGTLTELIPGATYVVYERAIPLDGNDQPTTDPNGEPKDSSKDNRKVVEHKDPKDKAQTFEVVKTPTTTPTSPVAPSTTPDKCVPVTTVSTVPGTTVAETTVPGTTVPETTVPGTPASTVPGTTVPGTTVPGTTVAPSTVPATTLPEHCVTTTPVTTTPVAPTTEPTQPTETVPAQPSTTEKPSKETTPTVPSSTTTPVVPPVVWFPNPQIGTTADFAGGAKEVKSGVVVNDTVKYQGLVPGKTYTLTAELVSKDAFNNLADKNAYGESVIGTGTKTFTASETGNGSVVVEIAVNEGIDTPVRAAVAFETLTSTEVNRDGQGNPQGGDTPGDTSDDNQIAEHKNIDDQNQTVRSPKTPGTPPVFEGEPAIGTNANFATGSKEVVAGATIVDTVRYSGLVPGKTYTLTADLVAKYNGAVIGQGEKRFTASENGFGAVDVDITVSSWVKEPVYAAVAFERLTSTEVDANGNELPEGNRVPAEVAQHRDINDAAQTVISPNISEGNELPKNPGVSTNADFANGAEVVNGAVVRDAVKYWGLIPGKTYTATAQLIERVGDKAPYSEGRVLGTQSVTFTPENTFGEINVDIPVTNAEGAVIAAVAYETLTSTEVDRNGKDNPKGGNTPDDYSDDNEIAEHKDINDSYQTVKTSEGVPPTKSQETPGTSTEETTPAPVPSESTAATTTPAPTDGGTSDEGSSVDKDKLKWLLLIPGLGLIPALLGGGGSSTPAPKPAPQPVPSKPAPAPAPSAPAGQAPKPAGQPVPVDSPRGEIKQIPSGGTALEAEMPAYI